MSIVDKQVAAAMLIHHVNVESPAGTDGRGGVRYEQPRVLTCYISEERKIVRNMEGVEVVSNTTLYFKPTQIDYKDRITLPSGRQPLIISIKPFYGEKQQMDLLEVNL